jgi:hypothetical protein
VFSWRNRIGEPGFPQLPANPVEIRPANFVGAIRSAERIDPIVAGYMEAALNFMTEAETNMNVLRGIIIVPIIRTGRTKGIKQLCAERRKVQA